MKTRLGSSVCGKPLGGWLREKSGNGQGMVRLLPGVLCAAPTARGPKFRGVRERSFPVP